MEEDELRVRSQESERCMREEYTQAGILARRRGLQEEPWEGA